MDSLAVGCYTSSIVDNKEREMNEEFFGQVRQEGYDIAEQNGEFLLVDLLGNFVDSRHPDAESLVRYCQKNVLTFLD